MQQLLLDFLPMEFKAAQANGSRSRRSSRRRKRSPGDDEIPSMSWDLVVAIRNGTVRKKMPADVYGPGFVPRPTDHLPGTVEKVDVLAKRAASFEQLFHCEDARES